MSALLAKARNNRESGFTLIELLTVIVIIGILAAIAIPVFSSQRARAQDADAVSETRSVVTAIESLAAGSTGGVLTGDASTAAGKKVLAQAITGEGATSSLPKAATGGAVQYDGDTGTTAVTQGDNFKTVITFNTTGTPGYTVETVSLSGKATKVATAPAAINTNTVANDPSVTRSVTSANPALTDRSSVGSVNVTPGTVVLGW